ncbi:MAG: hypothetical protein J0I20_30575 [Chloroflexi bacterium]|nr:hypothetical protein [Chloroflexota bacterium]OJV94824.1 MAG: hypothetical protein BGO39_34190 [Chloroflexi bacterium 54-19]
MPDQATITRIHQAAILAEADKRLEAAPFARRVLANDPENLAALLWLGYTSPTQLESEEAIAKAYDLHPQHPAVLKAVEWYNNYFIDAPAKPAVPSNSTARITLETPEPESSSKKANVMHTPVGEAVPDAANFFMSQAGSMVIGSTVVLVANLATFLNYTVLHVIRWTPFGAPRIFFALVALGLALIAAAFLFYSVRDVLTPPVKAHGFINNRREIKRRVKSETGTSYDLYYELDFLDDEAAGPDKRPVRLTLTRAQFEASAQTNRAFVVYSRRLGQVKLYQPLRSVYH